MPRTILTAVCAAAMLAAAGGTASAQQRLPISFGEERVVGREAALGSVMAAAVAPDGGVYVLDHVNSRLVAFDAEGRHRWSLGRRGRGPGEFQIPYRLDVHRDGTIFVFDLGTGEVTTVSPQGRYLNRYRLPFAFAQADGLVALDGALLIAGTTRAPARGGAIHRFQIQGSELRHTGSFGVLPTVRDPAVLQMWGAGALLRGASGRIWYTRRIPYEVYAFDASGTQRAVLRPPFRTRGTPDEAIRVERTGRTTTFSGARDNVEVPGQALELPGGVLLVSRVRPGAQFWDVFSSAGAYLGAYPRPARWEGIAGYDARRGVLWVTGTHADEPVLFRIPIVLSAQLASTRGSR